MKYGVGGVDTDRLLLFPNFKFQIPVGYFADLACLFATRRRKNPKILHRKRVANFADTHADEKICNPFALSPTLAKFYIQGHR
jgi:hypothetical protein